MTEAVRLQELSSNLLDYVRSGALDPRPVDPRAVLRESAEAVDRDRIVLHVEGAPERWRLDAVRMRQALGNLLRNAIQASPEGEPIDASVFADAGRLVFEVRDRGPGSRRRRGADLRAVLHEQGARDRPRPLAPSIASSSSTAAPWAPATHRRAGRCCGSRWKRADERVPMGRILVVDDEAGVRSFLAESLELGGMLPSPEVDTVPLA